MAYIETVAINIAGRVLSRVVTDLWRAGSSRMDRTALDARIDAEVRTKVGRARQSTVDDLRATVVADLRALARLSDMVRIDDAGLHTIPPPHPGRASGVRAIADKQEIHQVLTKLSAATAICRKRLKEAA